MKIAVEFPSVAYREGGAGIARLAAGIERIGFDQIDMFDHVVMGYALDDRPEPIYPPKMPIMEALTVLAYIAAATERIGLGTEVLVLPQRQPVLVAKQVATLDVLSGGRMRLGVGVGWQESEYEALGETFHDRGRRMDAAIRLIRQCWADERIDFDAGGYRLRGVAMEPKPPQGADLPIWIGGIAEPALRRAGELGDGWLGTARGGNDDIRRAMDRIREYASAAGRDPEALGMQMMIARPPGAGDDDARTFYADPGRVAARAAEIAALGFDWVTLNATALFQSGARSVDAMLEGLERLYGRIRAI